MYNDTKRCKSIIYKVFCACIFSNINILVPRTTNFRNFFLLNAYLSDLVGYEWTEGENFSAQKLAYVEKLVGGLQRTDAEDKHTASINA